MTELTVNREHSKDGFTPGELLFGGAHEAFTCEDVIREIPGAPVSAWKVPGETAIPAGRYRLLLDYSPRFAKDMPHVLDVPGFTGVRIHVGNTAKDTDGCLLIGCTRTSTGVAGSKAKFEEFIPKLEAALKQGEVWITYKNPPLITT